MIERARELGDSPSLAVFEAGSRLGGTIATTRHEGFLLEEGPDSFVTDKPWARDQIERLGLSARLVGTRPEFRRSFILHRKRLVPTPEGFYLMAPTRLGPFWKSRLFSLRGKLRASAELLLPPRRDGEDESLGGFVRRRFGRELLERAAQPMIGGIYGADPEDLSLASTFPRFLELERTHGSVIRGLRVSARASASQAQASGPRYGLFATLDEGLGVWVDALARALPEGSVRLGSRVESLDPGWTLRTSAGEERFDAVILAVPAYEAARLVRPWGETVARDLDSIPYASSVTVSLAFEERAIGHPMDGSGLVVPVPEGLSIVGCTFVHRKFAGRAPEGFALLRAFLGDAASRWSDEEVIRRVREELGPLLAISSDPLFARVRRHLRAMPRYRVGHLELRRTLGDSLARWPGLGLCGNGLDGVGLPDCVHSGERAAEAVLASASR